MIDYPFKSVFAARIQKISNSELDKYIATAGLEKLTKILPKEINLEENPDLIGVVGNLCVGGICNKNGDSISNETAIKIAKSFVWKYVDINHKKNVLCGTICNYGFSKYGTNEILTEDEAKQEKNPINISIAVLLYKSVLNDRFIDLLESSVDENSPEYNSLSFSWELLFKDYDICVGSKYVNEAKIVTDKEEKSKYEQYLLNNNGSGKDADGNLVYRLIKDSFCVGLGVGIVNFPAGNVLGLEIVNNEDDDDEEENEKSDISQNSKSDVILDRNDNKQVNNEEHMPTKITKLSDITDAILKEATASNITEFINGEIEKANEQWKTQLTAKETEVNDLSSKLTSASEKAQKAESDLAELTKKFEDLNSKIVAQETEQTFNSRMSYFDSEYELDKDYRAIIASDIKDLDEDAFAAYQKKAAILFKSINKKAIAEAKEKADAEAEKLKQSNASVSNTPDSVVDEAMKNGKKTDEIPNSTALGEDLLAEWAKEFKPEDCIVKIK